jgi:hypothetical protein
VAVIGLPAHVCTTRSATVCASAAVREDGPLVGRWRAAGRREQVATETDTGLFNGDYGSVDTNVSRMDCVGLCFV